MSCSIYKQPTKTVSYCDNHPLGPDESVFEKLQVIRIFRMETKVMEGKSDDPALM